LDDHATVQAFADFISQGNDESLILPYHICATAHRGSLNETPVKTLLLVVDAALEICGRHHLFISRCERLITEGHSNFLQRVASSFDVVPVSQSSGEQAEASDDQVEIATDACESIWRNHADDEIEDPIGSLDCGQ
jgi:hypothetical protein